MSGATILSPAATTTISLSEIPYNLEVPGVYYQVTPNYSDAGLLPFPAKALLIGAFTGTATMDGNVPYPVFSESQAQNLAGAGSPLAQMAAAFIKANPWTPVDIIGIPVSSYGHSAGQISISGTATATGTLALYIMGVRVATPVSQGDSASTVAGNIGTALQALTLQPGAIPFSSGSLPFAYYVTNAALYLAPNALGVLGNGLDIRLNAGPGEQTPAGLSVTITPFAGATEPYDITAALDAVANSWYTDIVCGFNDSANVAAFEAALAARYVANEKLDARGYRCVTGTPGTVQAAQAGLNSPFCTTLAMNNPMQPSWVIAASFAGACSYQLAQDPSRQLRGVPLPGIIAPAVADRYSLTDRQILLASGLSTTTVAVDGSVQLERVVTENTTDANGVPTEAWHDIMVPATLSRIRYDWIAYVSLIYPRNKLAPDGSMAAEYDPTVVTPKRMRGTWAARCRVYAENGWIVNVAQTVQASTFVIDANNPNRMNARQQIQLIGNLIILAGDLEFAAVA